MRNDQNQKRGLGRLGDFLAGKGFYIVLILCVAAIGISGYFLLTDSAPESQTVSGNVEVVVMPSPALPSVDPDPAPAPRQTPAPSQKPAAAAKSSPKPAPSPTPKPVVYTWPVKGEVVADYSLEVLAYDETMGDWRTHSGLDLAAPLGTQVLAVADGTVSSIRADALMGTTLTVSHEGGVTSVYANLAQVPAVAVGDSVTTGMVIGAVGDTAAAERGRVSHLHFEMTEEGRSVDPANYLP